MDTNKKYCLIVEGTYFDESEASDALRQPFIDEYCESTGSFRVHNFNEIEVAGGIALGDLAISMTDDEIFQITSGNANRLLTEQKAKMIAEALQRHGMFEEVRVEPLE